MPPILVHYAVTFFVTLSVFPWLFTTAVISSQLRHSKVVASRHRAVVCRYSCEMLPTTCFKNNNAKCSRRRKRQLSIRASATPACSQQNIRISAITMIDRHFWYHGYGSPAARACWSEAVGDIESKSSTTTANVRATSSTQRGDTAPFELLALSFSPKQLWVFN